MLNPRHQYSIENKFYLTIFLKEKNGFMALQFVNWCQNKFELGNIDIVCMILKWIEMKFELFNSNAK